MRLKAGYGVKNAVIGFSWSFSIVASLKKVDYVIFTFYFIKLFINSAIFDLKDKDVDEIETLPKILSETSFRLLLTVLNLTAHTTLFVSVGFCIVVPSSFVLTQIAIFSSEKTARRLIDLEPTLSAILYRLL